jgi:hypothetical protein
MMKSAFGVSMLDRVQMADYRWDQIRIVQVTFRDIQDSIQMDFSLMPMYKQMRTMSDFFYDNPDYLFLGRTGFAITYNYETIGFDACSRTFTRRATPSRSVDRIVIQKNHNNYRPQMMDANGVPQDLEGVWEISAKAAEQALSKLIMVGLPLITNGTLHLIISTDLYQYRTDNIEPDSATFSQGKYLEAYGHGGGAGIIKPYFARVLPGDQLANQPVVHSYFLPLTPCNRRTLITYPYSNTTPASMDVLPDPDLFVFATMDSRPGEHHLPDKLDLHIHLKRVKPHRISFMAARFDTNLSAD